MYGGGIFSENSESFIDVRANETYVHENMFFVRTNINIFVITTMETVTLTVDKQQDQLPLDEQCFSALHSITAHLNDNDFVEINRPILQLIGFRNSFIEKKDSKRNLQSDVNGHPLLKDMRNDFSTAVRCLRNTTGFIEGSSLTDTCAHFVLIKNREHVGGAGHNKQTLWVRKNALERWTRVCKLSGRTAKKIENGTV